jgi:hypothetical protein
LRKIKRKRWAGSSDEVNQAEVMAREPVGMEPPAEPTGRKDKLKQTI